MSKNISVTIYKTLPTAYLLLSMLYIILVIQPALYFHHAQTPFILSSEFTKHFFHYPGGVAELFANFIMQAFYIPYLGSVVLFSISVLLMFLTYFLLNIVNKNQLNIIAALLPYTFAITLINNYNFPFSIITSMIIVLLLLLFLAKTSNKLMAYLLCFSFGALVTYYFCGSGYLAVFSLSALVLPSGLRLQNRLIAIIYIIALSASILFLAYHFIFAIPPSAKFLYWFAPKIYFMAFVPSINFYAFILSVPLILLISSISMHLKTVRSDKKSGNRLLLVKHIVMYAIVISAAIYSHWATYQSDAQKIVASDYYCYKNDADKTAKTARSLTEYNFLANLNYNLVMSKADRLSNEAFSFMQISGTESLHPDSEFLAERSFIAADYYYHLGYISEARHWAYESLVYYPYSVRALQLLVKIHLVCGEYGAAGEYLKLLDKGLISNSFVNKYKPCIANTALADTTAEFVEKRNCMPDECELNPFIDQRFEELIAVNKLNKNAYNHLMLYCLLNDELERFVQLYNNAATDVKRITPAYEEALLIYGEINKKQVIETYNISDESVQRYESFKEILKKYKGDKRMGRSILYQKYGDSYLFYNQFVFPRILKPNIINDEDLPKI